MKILKDKKEIILITRPFTKSLSSRKGSLAHLKPHKPHLFLPNF